MTTRRPTTVGGDRLEGTIADFVRRCEMRLGEEGYRPNPDNALIAVLCDSIRLAREHCALATRMPREPWDVRAADALADEVAVLTLRKLIDQRSPAADALLDYRNPPCTPRSDRLAVLETVVTRLRDKVDAQLGAISRVEVECGPGGLSDPYKVQRNVLTWVRDELGRANGE